VPKSSPQLAIFAPGKERPFTDYGAIDLPLSGRVEVAEFGALARDELMTVTVLRCPWAIKVR
jgi:hypothetical protein